MKLKPPLPIHYPTLRRKIYTFTRAANSIPVCFCQVLWHNDYLQSLQSKLIAYERKGLKRTKNNIVVDNFAF